MWAKTQGAIAIALCEKMHNQRGTGIPEEDMQC
jgi:hypothetical protein